MTYVCQICKELLKVNNAGNLVHMDGSETKQKEVVRNSKTELEFDHRVLAVPIKKAI